MTIDLLIVTPQTDLADEVSEHLAATWPGWTATRAVTFDAAMACLEAETFDAALVDARLGDDETATLLEALCAAQPDCVRLVVTRADEEQDASALTSACHRVLVEPCDPLVMCTAVEHARRLRDTLGRTGVRALGLRRRNRDSRRPTGDLLSTV